MMEMLARFVAAFVILFSMMFWLFAFWILTR